MSYSEDHLPPQQLLTMQIIAGALLLGVLVILAIVLFLVFGNNDQAAAPRGTLPVLSLVAVLVLATNAPLAFVLPGLFTRNAVRQIAAGTWKLPTDADAAAFNTDISRLLAVRQTSLIIGLALLEGTAFLGCIALLLEKELFTLPLVAVAVLLMLVNFPTAGRVRAWLAQQIDLLATFRQERDVAAG